MFGDIEIEKRKFHYHQSTIHKDDVDTDKMLISDKLSLSKNLF